ncbi:hypothetical protein ANN_19372 [Periplaneta americana]|uniref:Mutator-like transposase domain-containing protein n=1 Tax=Periplaneta americana TaxID=6978 RepID=A0ABQ8S9Q7_PERAM|nr:hypothetical protein ANN_19372 [Periplaneta americana]
MRSIGRGRKPAQTLCGIMDLPPPTAKFNFCTSQLLKCLEEVAKKSMTNAIEEAVALNENSRDITAAFDGSWQKRGHTSLNGVITATSLDNGKVIDVECLTKFCHNCKSDQPGHICMKNYDGFSGGMESDGVVKIFQRSENLYQVRYVNYLGDGDSKGYKKVEELNVYGNVEVSKLECCGHVQKRMGTRLRKLCKDMKDAVICFNDGSVSRLNVLESLGIEVGSNTKTALYTIDKKRFEDGEKFALQMTKEARTRKRNAKRRREDQETQEQDELDIQLEPYSEHLKRREAKRREIGPDFYATNSMLERNWTKENREQRHVLTRLAIHGFHHKICSDKTYHNPSDSCVCELCSQRCDRYHITVCHNRLRTRRMERMKWTERIRNEAVLERVGEERIMLAKKNLSTRGCSGRTGEWGK